jgi:hypothetical protein
VIPGRRGPHDPLRIEPKPGSLAVAHPDRAELFGPRVHSRATHAKQPRQSRGVYEPRELTHRMRPPILQELHNLLGYGLDVIVLGPPVLPASV